MRRLSPTDSKNRKESYGGNNKKAFPGLHAWKGEIRKGPDQRENQGRKTTALFSVFILSIPFYLIRILCSKSLLNTKPSIIPKVPFRSVSFNLQNPFACMAEIAAFPLPQERKTERRDFIASCMHIKGDPGEEISCALMSVFYPLNSNIAMPYAGSG